MTKVRAAATLLTVLCAALPRAAAAQPASSSEPFEQIRITAGRSHVMEVGFDLRRVAVTNPAIADAVRVSAREVLIDAKGPGLTSLIVWGDTERVQYDIVVSVPVPPLEEQLQSLFPGEHIHVSVTEDAVVLSGQASSNTVALRAAELAQTVFSKLRIVNMIERGGGPTSQQVMLEVRFAEVDHNSLLELGATILGQRPSVDFRTTTQQFPQPFVDNSGTTPTVKVPDYLNIFLSLNKEGLLATIRALKQRGKLQSLAEPNLIAYNGQEASFLAGGEFPVPLVQGATGQVTVQYREFGVKLNFRPTIAGEVIRLKVRPEVSTLDFSNGVILSGFRIPALKKRYADTDVELRDGQSFVIAGLLDNQSLEDRQAVPFLSSLPVIGTIFKSKSESAQRSELLVLITPHLVRPLEPSEVPPLPVDMKSFLRPEGAGSLLQGGGGFVDGPPADAPKEHKP